MCVANLEQVSFAYPGSPSKLLGNVSFAVHAGEVVQLAGPNGCGKSTLLALLAGRLPPTDGLVRVLDDDPFHVSRAPAIGVINEPFHPAQSPLPVDLTGREVVTWLEILDGIHPSDVHLAASSLQLDESLLARPIDTLSKGERQRVLLLVALLRSPTLLLADEPLEGLDHQSRRLIGQTLHAYAKENQRAVVWVSHHLADTLVFADRLLVVENQTVVEQPCDRYNFVISAGDASAIRVSAPSLFSLPEILASQFPTAANLRIEVTDRSCSSQEALSCDD